MSGGVKMGIGAVGYNNSYYRTSENTGRKADSRALFGKNVQNYNEANRRTAQELKEEKDWRKMSEDEWKKIVEGVDDYIDAVKKQSEQLKQMQDEAAQKAAMEADCDTRTTAASAAALKTAANGAAGIVAGNEAGTEDDDKNWTKNLKTEDQTILRTAGAAQDREKMAMSRLQEIQLMDQTGTGISRTENVTECVSVEEDENNDKIWTITSFGEDGIISKRFQNGKELDSWEIKYQNPGDAKKVWDFLAKFKDDEELEFAGSKDFWEKFLTGNADIDSLLAGYEENL